MDFSTDPADTAAALAFDRFCQERLAPRAKAVDEGTSIPKQNWADLHEMGFFKMHYPEEVGGFEVSWEVRAMAQESLAKACAATFLSTGASIGLFGAPIFVYGTKAQKERGQFIGFSRTAFGIVKTRTNGKRLFVYTDSGNTQMKEAYAYELDSSGVPQPSVVLRA